MFGDIQYRSGNYDSALSKYWEAVRLKPNYDQAYYNMALVYEDTNQFEKAVDAYHLTLKANPDFVFAYTNLGQLYHRMGMDAEAIIAFKTAIKLDPNEIFAYFNLGISYIELDSPQEAEFAFRSAISIKPDHAPSHSSLGNILIESNRLEEAEREFSLAIQSDPNDPICHHNLGNLLYITNRREQALISYQRALELNPNFEPSKAAIKHHYQDSPNQNLPYADLSNNNFGTKALEHLSKALEYGEINEYHKKADELMQAIQLEPSLEEAYVELAYTLFITGQINESEKNIRTALNLSKSQNSTYHAHLGLILLVKKQVDEAEIEFKTAIALNPNDSIALFNFGGLLKSQNRLKEAEGVYRKVLSITPENAFTYNALAKILHDLGQEQESIEMRALAVKLNPSLANDESDN